jgi:predicted DNA-binding transcriptional regulator AlpA
MSTVTSLPEHGFVRLPSILQIFPVSRSAWWQGVAEGRYPASVKLSPRATAWRVEDVRKLCESIGGAKDSTPSGESAQANTNVQPPAATQRRAKKGARS